MSDEIKKDSESRKIIREELDRNLFVEAGAGSGKTTELVTRMVNLVKSGKDIEKICAITFTKAAANEFYRRFKQEIEKEAATGNAICADALRKIDLCFMGTIDSFCQMVLQEHPTEAGIPSDAQIAEAEAMKVYYLRMYSEIQGGIHGPEMQKLCRCYQTLVTKHEQLYLELVSVLMNKRNTEIVYERSEKTLNERLSDEKSILCKVYEVLKKHPEFIITTTSGGKTYANHEAAKNDLLGAGGILSGDWEDEVPRLANLLESLKNLHLHPTSDMSLFGIAEKVFEWHDDKQSKLDLASDFRTGLLEKLKGFKYNTAMKFADLTVSLIKDELRKEGKLSYFDYQYYLKEMLKKDADGDGKLIRHIYDRHSYFLLDEFQDTDPMQAEIFFYLSAEKIDPDWKKCIPHKGSLFIVGDPKQSIYRFRNADVGSYNTVKSLFTGAVGQQVKLTCNFRSTLTVCNWFNRVFPSVFPEKETAEQSTFEQIPVDERTDIPDTYGGVYEYKAGSAEEDPEAVLRIVEKLVGNGQFKIQEKEDESPRLISYRDIMVITTSKPVLGKYIGVFEKHHIPYLVEGTAEFKNCPALVAIANVFSAVAEPDSRTCLYRALTGSIFGISNSDLLKETYANGFPKVYGDSDTVSDAEIKKATECICELVRKSKSTTPSGMFSIILDECGIFRLLGYENAEYAYYALELLRTKEASGEISTMKEGAAFLDELLAGESGLERILSLTQNQDRVHIANLHKVKGLEAPIVILATARKYSKVSIRTDLSSDPAKTWVFEIKDKSDNKHIKLLSAPGYATEKNLEAESQNAENTRLLYVAATRAKRALLIGTLYDAENEKSPDNYWLPLLKETLPEFDYSIAEKTERCVSEEISAAKLQMQEKTTVTETANSRDESYKIHLPSKEKIRSNITPEDQAEDRGEEIPDDSEKEHAKEDKKSGIGGDFVNAAVLGTVVHRLMEILVTSRNSVKLDDVVKDILAEYGAEPSKYEEMLLTVGKTVQSGGYEQKNGMEKDILTELLSADEVYCEYPFCYESADRRELWNGVMDVVYRKNGKWHIVDYKTNEQDTELDGTYKNQLDAYVEAFRIINGLEADAKIYHIAAK